MNAFCHLFHLFFPSLSSSPIQTQKQNGKQTNTFRSPFAMKKLKGANRVHPSPPATSRHLSSLLPSAIMSLAASLSPEEQEVLAYLLSASAGDRWAHPPHDRKRQKTHRADLACGCFSCYKSFWARWDSSPNRHVIHLIIDKVEEEQQEPEEKVDPFHPRGRNRRRRTGRKKTATDEDRKEILQPDSGHVDGDDDEVDVEAEEEGKSSVRRFVSFIGERVWGVWNN